MPLVALGAVLLVAYLATPGKSPWLPPCLFHLATGLHCPGCGATRALHALTHGDWREALRMNLLIVLALPLLAIVFTLELWNPMRGRRHISHLPAVTWTLLVIVIAYGILRNLPWWPFTWLAPQ